MKRILQKINWQIITKHARESLMRFPVASVALFVLAVSLIIKIQSSDIIEESLLVQIVFSSLFAVWISVALQLGWEALEASQQMRMRLFGLAVLFVGVYASTFPSDLTSAPFEFFAIHIAVHVMLGITLLSVSHWVAWYRGEYQDAKWYACSFNTTLYCIQALALTLLLSLLGILLLWTIESLFDPAWFASEFYMQWVVIAGVLFGPLYFLSMLPQKISNKLVVGERFVHLLIRYIALPFIYVYFVILYLYTIKVLFGLPEWPQGEVSILVIYFSFFSYLVYLFSYQLEDEPWIAHTRRLLPILLVPQIAMLFYSIGLRIEEYGWTINRYLVVMLGMWLALMSLYHMYRYQYVPRLIIIPSTLAGAILIALVGPWSMYGVSEQSQSYRLENMLIQADMLNEEGSLRGLSSAELEAMSDTDKRNIISAIRYLCDYHGCDSLRTVLPAKFLDTIADEREEGLDAYAILEELNLPHYIPLMPDEDRYLNVYDPNYLSYRDVSGYTHLFAFAMEEEGRDDGRAWYDTDTGEVVITAQAGETLRIPARKGLVRIVEERGEGVVKPQIDQGAGAQSFDFEIIHQEVKYMIVISRISGERNEGDIEIDYVQGVVLY